MMGVQWANFKQQTRKEKKAVDTRASKGRKLRYEPHEKLQNFMVPVATGTWHEEMIDELYTSLLGHKRSIEENEKIEDLDVGEIKIFG